MMPLSRRSQKTLHFEYTAAPHSANVIKLTESVTASKIGKLQFEKIPEVLHLGVRAPLHGST